jgi:5-methylcytosine-specific restriction enzyme A
MPYKNNDYKNFIRSAEWQRIRAAHLKANPLCVFCKKRGITKQAEQVDHITPCMHDPALQRDPNNLRSLCAPCHAPLRHSHKRGYSTAIDVNGYPTDPRHPFNRPRQPVKAWVSRSRGV